MTGGGIRSPPPMVVNSEGFDDGTKKIVEQGSFVDSGWKRGGRLRSCMQTNKNSMETEECFDTPPSHDGERSERRISCSPGGVPSVHDQIEAMEEAVPHGNFEIDEQVPPRVAPLHAPLQEIGSVDDFLNTSDVVMEGCYNNMHGSMHSHGIETSPCEKEFPCLPSRKSAQVGCSNSSPSTSLPSLMHGRQDGMCSILGLSPSVTNGQPPPPRPPSFGVSHVQPSHGHPNGMNQPQGSKPSNSQPPNAWRARKCFKFAEIEQLRDILGEDGISIKMDCNESGMCRSKLECALVAKIIGKSLPFPFLIRELKRRWAQFGQVQISPIGKDSFICIFNSMQARDAVLAGGPWFVGGQIIGMDAWSPKFNPASFKGITSPIWIRLPELPLQYWSPKNLGRIATKVGLPLWIDDYTLNWERLEYARVCVKVDFSQSLPNGVWLQGYQENFFQPFVYEGISQLCFKCGKVGHIDTNCVEDLNPKGSLSHMNSALPTKEPPLVKKTSSTSLNKSPRWAKMVESQHMPELSPPDLEVQRVTPPPSRPHVPRNDNSTTKDGGTQKGDDMTAKRSSVPLAPTQDDMGYGPWTLVTYRKKKVGPTMRNVPPRLNPNPKPGIPKVLLKIPGDVDTSKRIIFTASTKEGDGTSHRQKSKQGKPKNSPHKSLTTASMVILGDRDIDFDGNRKRKKRFIGADFVGGDAPRMVSQ